MNISKVNTHFLMEEHPATKSRLNSYLPFLLLGLILLIWPLLQRIFTWYDPTIGFVDPNIWLLLLFSLVSFLIFLGIAWWLLKLGWQMLRLPSVSQMVSQFKMLESWQQLSFFWASYALLLWVAQGIFSAVL